MPSDLRKLMSVPEQPAATRATPLPRPNWPASAPQTPRPRPFYSEEDSARYGLPYQPRVVEATPPPALSVREHANLARRLARNSPTFHGVVGRGNFHNDDAAQRFLDRNPRFREAVLKMRQR